jgi:dihydroxyacetone kinase-like protein
MRGIEAAYQAVLLHRAEIEELDQAIGDGDHVFNLIRGLEAVRSGASSIEGQDLSNALKSVARKILETVGGSSGPLFSTLILAMSKTAPVGEVTLSDWSRMFAEGVSAMATRGKAGVGEKTMLDVLIPVSQVFSRFAAQGVAQSEVLAAIKLEAERGMLATKEMVATKGRASFLGDRAIGHIDPGARSSQIILGALCDLAGQEA